MDKLEVTRVKVEQFAHDCDCNQFHSPKNPSLALSVEASELVECFLCLMSEQREANIDKMVYVETSKWA
ncbi:hypothetical protein RED65_14717 [Oceanobacter sp. RED65]|uniref:Uncharacterized protein n=1 Tax=Bermanella marisrubri TaxID=207949 RepID=Q1N4A7_9GAMM|nr:hypothetical protein RED65_14717 [Oceanobacter sp. RED65] [Bermanella marisrubri]